ncbi:MAG: integrase family protein (integrase domain protein) [Candidatus Magnetoglobus multicellularis str. Araruama]|uniref:Integrase family protein (Integrase domain protein) n=1 Tax=Candidatus Magnetoglobus multicellularis str. Araruama TaxID=890399 RepID=A0A1V1P3M7_9BACT|nr:MAG: integrase family protein (integrase domain protein) [Candidatus Magnetoglobus multicellularis str. Araruama]
MEKLNIELDKDFQNRPLDDQFNILLHKKLLGKNGAAKRAAKKYYIDQYNKTGIIPMPLLLVKNNIFEGRKASGRKPSLSNEVRDRFTEMVVASSDIENPNFIFVTQRARKISTFHAFLENEYKQKISISALRRFAKLTNLTWYLQKDDFSDDTIKQYYFEPVPVFDLIQVDGCTLRYLKIKDENDQWKKPVIIEFYDTGSRYMLVLDAYFSESSENSVNLFTQFLSSTPFPDKPICIRPDNAKGFLNLKRPIHELNVNYSIMPDRFILKPDFSRIHAPKDKVHLESSHRSLHNFEIMIINKFANKICDTKSGYVFSGNKKNKITVTYLDIKIDDLRESGLLDQYRRKHNENAHYFSERGQVTKFVPHDRFSDYMSKITTITFNPRRIKNFMRYGFDKINAKVTKGKNIRYNNQEYYVVDSKYKFSTQVSTQVKISEVNNKLLIFEDKKDGVFLGEALPTQSKTRSQSELKKTQTNQ